MTQISSTDVQHLARLSSLQLSDAEAEALRGDLEAIISYIDQLGELDTSQVEPTYQVTDLENVFRGDDVDNYGMAKDALLGLAPDAQDDQVKVPKVL